MATSFIFMNQTFISHSIDFGRGFFIRRLGRRFIAGIDSGDNLFNGTTHSGAIVDIVCAALLRLTGAFFCLC